MPISLIVNSGCNINFIERSDKLLDIAAIGTALSSAQGVKIDGYI